MKEFKNKKIVLDYIYGNDIIGYEIDELENDYIFMMTVINHTKDKNFYDLCSDKVKTEKEFVLFLLQTFKNDLDFITKVANTFLDNNNDDLSEKEICILMTELTEKEDEIDKRLKYGLISFGLYSSELVNIEAMKIYAEKDNPEFLDVFGFGFLYISDKYKESTIIINFFAKKFILELFFTNRNFNLEKYIHLHYKNFNQIEIDGINNFCINLINRYDTSLAEYSAIHTEILSDLKQELKRIKSNWKTFEYNNERQKYELLFEKIDEYLDINMFNYSFSYTEIIYYIASELGLVDKIRSYDVLEDKRIDEVLKNSTLNKDTMNFRDLTHYYNIKKIFQEILGQKIFEEPADFETLDSSPNIEGKIIEVDFANKKLK